MTTNEAVDGHRQWMLLTHCLIGSPADNIELGHDELEIHNAGFMAAVLSQVNGGGFKSRYGREQKQDQDEEKNGREGKQNTEDHFSSVFKREIR